MHEITERINLQCVYHSCYTKYSFEISYFRDVSIVLSLKINIVISNYEELRRLTLFSKVYRKSQE